MKIVQKEYNLDVANHNIRIAYVLAFAKNTWFWLGIWIFYYLRFTNYSGIGLIETTLVITLTLAEIPTGAIADLLGKKKTLIAAFLFEAIGAFMMATAPSFLVLLSSVFVMCIGGALYSGTIDALVFDSLKQDGKEDSYIKKIANINTLSLIAPAMCGVLGGFMYKIDPTLPFFANGVGYTVGLIAAFFLIEPRVDSIKFSISSFINQTKQGIKQLFSIGEVKNKTILLLSIGFVVVIGSEMLNSFLGVEFGFKETELGVLWSVIYLTSAVSSQATPILTKYFKNNFSILFVGIVIALTLLVSPFLGLAIGGLSLIVRTSFEGIFGNLSSSVINAHTESKYRATTISTFNMIKNVPYVLAAYFIGSISDQISAKNTAFILGVALLIYMSYQCLVRVKHLRLDGVDHS